MRDHFKTRAVWLTKGIAAPLGTLASLVIILIFFQYFKPGSEPKLIFCIVPPLLLFCSLLFARKLEKKYQAFLGASLGMDVLKTAKKKQSP